VIPVQPSAIGLLSSGAADVTSLVHTLSAAAPELEADVRATLAELRRTLVATREAARSLRAGVDTLSAELVTDGASLRATAADLQRLLEDPAWRGLGGDAVAAVDDVRRLTARLDALAASLDGLVGENRGAVRAITGDLRRASGDLRAAARRVRESPASLLHEHPLAEKPVPDPAPDGGAP
jgi:hypothetical protein